MTFGSILQGMSVVDDRHAIVSERQEFTNVSTIGWLRLIETSEKSLIVYGDAERDESRVIDPSRLIRDKTNGIDRGVLQLGVDFQQEAVVAGAALAVDARVADHQTRLLRNHFRLPADDAAFSEINVFFALKDYEQVVARAALGAERFLRDLCTLRELHAKFRAGVVEKNYLALGVGDWQLGEQIIDAPLLVSEAGGNREDVQRICLRFRP